MDDDDELALIRRRKMEALMRRAREPKVQEPLANGRTNPLTDGNFWSTLRQTRAAVVDVYGEWCGPCKAVAPILEELAQQYAGRVFFGKLDIDRNPRTTAQFGIRSVPMVIGFKNGRSALSLLGLRPHADYVNMIERLLK